MNLKKEKYFWSESLHTDATEMFTSICPNGPKKQIHIKLRVLRNTDIEAILLYTVQKGDEIRIPLKKLSCVDGFDWWGTGMDINHKTLSYRFRISTSTGHFFWDAKGSSLYNVTYENNFKIAINPKAPDWIFKSVFYHIFVDRFNKDGANGIGDKKTSEVSVSKSYYGEKKNLSWGEIVPYESNQFFNGDLDGIREKTEYLKYLGITTICISPIFLSSSSHRYDVQDYYVVDPVVGTKERLLELVEFLHRNGMRIVFDGVFNHTGVHHRWFNKLGQYPEKGAFQDKNSRYAGFYYFRDHPNDYETFMGCDTLPKLNYDSKELREFVYGLENSIVKYWSTKPFEVDGWRLDCACMIGKSDYQQMNGEVLAEMYDNIKKLKGDSYVFGEHPFDPSDLIPFVNVDGITNYSGFYNPVLMWLMNPRVFTAQHLTDAMDDFRAKMGFQFANASLNFIGNHDKQRMFSILSHMQKYKLAVVLMFTQPGIPCIYYGEEIGLHSFKIRDDSRICMNWEKANDEDKLFLFYRKLIGLYKSSTALQTGSYKSLSTNRNVFSFVRFDKREMIIVMLNNGRRKCDYRLSLTAVDTTNRAKFTDLLDSGSLYETRNQILTIGELKAYEAKILRRVE